MWKVPSIQVLTEGRLTLHNEDEFRTPFEWFPVDVYNTWMERTYDIPYKNPYFSVTTEPN